MPARTPTPGAIRNRRYRRRLRESLTVAPVEVPANVIDALIDHEWLAEDDAEDPHRLGEAVLKAAEAHLLQQF